MSHTVSIILKYSNITVTPYHWVAETMHAAFSMYTCSMSSLKWSDILAHSIKQ